MRTFALAGLALATALAATPAAAEVETFASFNSTSSARNFNWVGTNSNAVFYTTSTATANTAGATAVTFNFLQQPFGGLAGPVSADFLMQGSVTNTNAVVSGSFISQSNISGSFSFTSTSAFTVGANTYGVGTNLLSGVFTLAEIGGTRNGSSGGFSASTPVASITYTSDVLGFFQNSNYDLALSLTSISPKLNATNASNQTTGAPNKALRSFRAVVGGQFSSDPLPTTPEVPEPAVWAQLIAGFALVGVAARRRKTTVAA